MSTFELDAIRQHPDKGPVTMLNLLKFREQSLDGNGTGRDAYNRYAAVAKGLVEARGGRVVWVGSVDHPALHEGGDVEWDVSQLVYYPSRAAFIDMVTSPEYLKANVDRTNGTEKHAILACTTRLATSFPKE
ncbi:MAG: DUF1330 domain-containing protein [Myxococcota bacterium]